MTEDLARIGRYEVITRLAIGGMAELFLARERGIAGLERVVVIKRILPQLADKPRFIDMFLREARIAARLAHPNVVQIFDLGEEDGNFFIAMEYIHGSTVRELQVLADQHGRKWPLGVTIGVITQALRGLHAAHELQDLDGRPIKLVHRDISPHNLMCTTDGSVKLLDFGVAKATEEGFEATNSGHLKGKFAYMSPEQARREDLDRRSDVFGMGVVAWEMLTGLRLFRRETEVDMLKAVMQDDVPPPSSVDPSIPPGIEDVIMHALAKDRSERIATADEMRQRLLAAAHAAQVDVGSDPVADWVEHTAGTYLDLRKETLQKALERNLTARERDGLLHVTGSNSASMDADLNIDLAVKRTQDAIRDARERSSSSASSSLIGRSQGGPAASGLANAPAALSTDTVIAKHRTASVEDAGEPAQLRAARRRIFLLMGAAFLAVLSAIAIIVILPAGEGEPEAPVLLGEPVSIAWSPTVDPEILRAEVEPLRKYLERSLGRPVVIEITDSYAASSEQLLRGDVTFALLPPLMYLRTRAKDDRIEPIAIKLFDGAAHSDGLLLVLGDSGHAGLEGFSGKRFCFTDKNSTTGHFLPTAYIRRQGWDPEKFIGEVHWSGDHIQAIRDLLAHKCDVAAVYSGAFISADKFGIPISQLRQIAITGNVPQDPFVAGPRTSSSDRESMRKALLAFDPQKELGIPRLGETQRITAFAEGGDEVFQFLRGVVEESEAIAKEATD